MTLSEVRRESVGEEKEALKVAQFLILTLCINHHNLNPWDLSFGRLSYGWTSVFWNPCAFLARSLGPGVSVFVHIG